MSATAAGVSFPVLCGQPRALPGLVPRLMSAHALCVVWLVRVRRAAWFLRVLQEMLVLRDIPGVPGRLMGDGRAICP